MSILSKKELGVHQSKIFIDSLSDTTMNVNLYLAVSHAQPWANEAAPNTSIDNIEDTIAFWRGMFAGKKITGNDVACVVPRVNWANNTNYRAFSHTGDTIHGDNFYVLTSDFNVYKCLSNNAGANSTTEPTYTSYDRANREDDDYVWKYLYSLTTAERTRFLTDTWMPATTKTLNDGSLHYLVQENAFDGGIEHVFVSNVGSGYTNTANLSISFTGDGSGAVAVANINTTSQTVVLINMTNPGSGYSFANCTLSGGAGTGASLIPVISPAGGHGNDPVSELGASNIMINIRLKNDETDQISIQNDFRQIGIIKNPLLYGTSNLFSNAVFSQTTDIVVSEGSEDYALDEYVYQGPSVSSSTFAGRVLNWDAANNKLGVVETSGTPTSTSLIGETSGTYRFPISTSNPELIYNSGKVLLIENVVAIQRSSEQTEDLKCVLEF